MLTPRPWFVARRRFGWGWRPATWQGWTVTLAYVGAIGGLSALAGHDVITRTGMWLATVVASAALLAVLALTGTRPGGRLF